MARTWQIFYTTSVIAGDREGAENLLLPGEKGLLLSSWHDGWSSGLTLMLSRGNGQHGVAVVRSSSTLSLLYTFVIICCCSFSYFSP